MHSQPANQIIKNESDPIVCLKACFLFFFSSADSTTHSKIICGQQNCKNLSHFVRNTSKYYKYIYVVKISHFRKMPKIREFG